MARPHTRTQSTAEGTDTLLACGSSYISISPNTAVNLVKQARVCSDYGRVTCVCVCVCTHYLRRRQPACSRRHTW